VADNVTAACPYNKQNVIILVWTLTVFLVWMGL